ncbi:MAG: DUF4974 domain-containing protein [Sphingobacterium sp.]|jgi:ferric-dicitrate binding protein FerR (iron transport regulator)|nr:DUF4974 domain-containing protein [Sphingobacterium sp.]
MTNKEDLFERYLAGNCTPEEKELIENWYAHYLKETPGKAIDAARFEHAVGHKKLSLASRSKRRTLSIGVRVAASILLFCTAAGLIYTYLLSSPSVTENADLAQVYPTVGQGYIQFDGHNYAIDTTQKHIKIDLQDILLDGTASSLALNPADSRDIKIKSPLSHNLTVQLADGSSVMLNSGSELSIPKNFSPTHRSVSLQGEAFFDITKRTEPNSSFRVSFLAHQVEVLGTSFNINASPEIPELRVSLFTGKVKLTKGQESTFLMPGDSYEFNKSTGETSVHRQVTLDSDRAWTTDVFIFESESIKEVAALLARWYDMEIVLDPSVDPKESFTGILSRKKSLLQLLEAINSNSQYNYQIDMKERRITIQKS